MQNAASLNLLSSIWNLPLYFQEWYQLSKMSPCPNQQIMSYRICVAYSVTRIQFTLCRVWVCRCPLWRWGKTWRWDWCIWGGLDYPQDILQSKIMPQTVFIWSRDFFKINAEMVECHYTYGQNEYHFNGPLPQLWKPGRTTYRSKIEMKYNRW